MTIVINKVLIRPVTFLLFTATGMITHSTLSPAELLKVGNTYEGERVADIFQPGDQDYAETAEQAVIVAKADASTTLYWSDAKTSSDKLEGMGYGKINLPGKAGKKQLVEVNSHLRKSS